MVDLNKEAEEYLKQWDWAEDVNGIGCFIAGANSKYVQSEKIKAQIEALTNLQLHFDISKNDAIKRCETAISELEQQLNQL